MGKTSGIIDGLGE